MNTFRGSRLSRSKTTRDKNLLTRNVKTGIVLSDELETTESAMFGVTKQAYTESQIDHIVPDETKVLSYGLVPIEFDKPDRQVEDMIDMVKRGVL